MTRDNQILFGGRAVIEGLMVNRVEKNKEIVVRCINEIQFRHTPFRLLVHCIHERIRTKDEGHHAE